MWEKGLSSHHEVSGNKELGTSAFIFLAPIIISVDGQHPVGFFPFVFTVIQEYLQKKKKKKIFGEWPLLWIRALLCQHWSPWPQGAGTGELCLRGCRCCWAWPALRVHWRQLYPCFISPLHQARNKGSWTVRRGCGLGWRVRWCMWRYCVPGSTLLASHSFVLAGLHTGTVLLRAISIAKKRSKPRDNLVNDLPVLANLV